MGEKRIVATLLDGHRTSSAVRDPRDARTHVVQRVGGFVHATVQQLCDAKLLDVASHFVGGAAQDVVRLRGRSQTSMLISLFQEKNQQPKSG